MTITVELEELRDFEANCSQWADRRSVVVIDIMMKLQQQSHGIAYSSMGTVELGKYLRNTLDEWDKLNPIPKLIPNV